MRVISAGMPVTAVREMRVLQNCQHQNLVALKEVVTGSKPDRQVVPLSSSWRVTPTSHVHTCDWNRSFS